MKKTLKKFAAVVLAGAMCSSNYALAASPSNGASVKPRVQYAQGGFAMPLSVKGVKSFEVFGTATPQLVVDEGAVAPSTGLLASISVSTGSCFVLVFDSASASGLNENTAGKALLPPLVANSNTMTSMELSFPIQFHYGLVAYVSSALCRANVTWGRNGRAD